MSPIPTEDRRLLILCTVGAFILGAALALIGLVVWVDAHPAPGADGAARVSPLLLIGGITAFAGVSLTQVWAMVKQEQDRVARARFRDETTDALAEIKSTAEATTTHATTAVQTAKSMTSEIKEALDTLIRQTNGELDKKIVGAVSAAMEPTHAKIADIDTEIHKIKHSMANLADVKMLKDAGQKLKDQ